MEGGQSGRGREEERDHGRVSDMKQSVSECQSHAFDSAVSFVDTSTGRQLSSLLVVSLHHVESDEGGDSVSGRRGLIDAVSLVDSAAGSDILSLMSLSGKLRERRTNGREGGDGEPPGHCNSEHHRNCDRHQRSRWRFSLADGQRKNQRERPWLTSVEPFGSAF